MSSVLLVEHIYTHCPTCSSHQITEERRVEEVRATGDAMGEIVASCPDCGWTTSLRFDDAADYHIKATPKGPHGVQELGVSSILQWLKRCAFRDAVMAAFEHELVDGEVLLRDPPFVTAERLVRWGLSTEEVATFAERYHELSHRDLEPCQSSVIHVYGSPIRHTRISKSVTSI